MILKNIIEEAVCLPAIDKRSQTEEIKFYLKISTFWREYHKFKTLSCKSG
jgi:hypothetical protein